MRTRWTSGGVADLKRLTAFAEAHSAAVADAVVEMLTEPPARLLAYPRMGMRLDAFDPREVRQLIVGDYELRYEIWQDQIITLRIFHGLEDR